METWEILDLVTMQGRIGERYLEFFTGSDHLSLGLYGNAWLDPERRSPRWRPRQAFPCYTRRLWEDRCPSETGKWPRTSRIYSRVATHPEWRTGRLPWKRGGWRACQRRHALVTHIQNRWLTKCLHVQESVTFAGGAEGRSGVKPRSRWPQLIAGLGIRVSGLTKRGLNGNMGNT